MATGYSVGGVDLDDILEPIGSTSPPAAVTGYEVLGADLNTRFAAVAEGTAAPATGYTVAGVDIGSIFAAKGSVSGWLTPWNGRTLSATALELNNGTAEATSRIRLTAAGEYVEDKVTSNGGGSTTSTTPVYFLPAGINPAEVEVRATQTSGDTISNSMATWQPLTLARSVSLTASSSGGEGRVDLTASVQIEAREILNPSNKTSGVVYLNADATSEA